MAAISSARALDKTSEQQAKHFQRLSSGKRITTSADDAAGLSISESMRAQVRSTKQAERNAMDGVSLVQVAEGGLSEISNILVRMRELAIQAATDTVGEKERGFINNEVESLKAEVDRIANVTSFNGTPLLNGEADKSELEFHVGISNNDADRIVFEVGENNIQAGELGVDGVSAESIDSARDSLDAIDQGLTKVSEVRARLGAMQNKLRSTSNTLQIQAENITQAQSRIADTDLASEVSELVRENILQSAGVSVLAQANQSPMQALKLL
jgi:flagellin